MMRMPCVLSCRAPIIAAVSTAAITLIGTPAIAAERPTRVCFRSEYICIWVSFGTLHTTGGYDAVTLTGAVGYSTDGPFDPDDFLAINLPDGMGGVTSFVGGQTSVTGSYEVLGGLGTAACTVDYQSLDFEAGGYSIEIVNQTGSDLVATLPLTGFNDSGQGLYYAEGLSLPVLYSVTTPSGSTYMLPDVITALELRSSLDLSPPCLADQDGNGIFDLTDIGLFIQGFLSRCE
tara:strand:- start:38 stop:736 length:699 start_codon:yes stop_codon:yes gene_type:complete